MLHRNETIFLCLPVRSGSCMQHGSFVLSYNAGHGILERLLKLGELDNHHIRDLLTPIIYFYGVIDHILNPHDLVNGLRSYLLDLLRVEAHEIELSGV